MLVQPDPGVVSVDVEGVFREPGDRRAHQSAAQCKDQPIIRQRLGIGKQDAAVCEVDVGHVGFDAGYANRAQYVVEWNAGVAELRLVIAHADRVKRAAIDQCYRNAIRPDAQFVELARSTNRRP